jgi:hypothetical protein
VGKVFQEIDATLRSFIEAQHVFFVATSPLDAAGHVNLSPKGLDTLRIISPTTVAYLDYVGSGAETIAHLRENGRIVLMLCAFEGAPKIVRLHGRGTVLEPQDPDYARLRDMFPAPMPDRSIVHVALDRISDSCGYAVPRYTYEGERQQLQEWTVRKTPSALAQYQSEKNRVSVDGLPALRWVDVDHPSLK